jgi:Cu(I)/Ag(I) efflux system membrane fusion protein
MYVNKGQTLFSLNDLQQVWTLVSVPNERLSQIHENQSAEIISETSLSKTFAGRVVLIEQTFEEAGQRFARVRVAISNPDNLLKINSLVTAQFSVTDNDNSLQVPASAVYKTGLNAYVWVKIDTTKSGTGIFELRNVIAGATNNGMTAVASGLSPDEEIAIQAGLLADSETFLNAD